MEESKHCVWRCVCQKTWNINKSGFKISCKIWKSSFYIIKNSYFWIHQKNKLGLKWNLTVWERRLTYFNSGLDHMWTCQFDLPNCLLFLFSLYFFKKNFPVCISKMRYSYYLVRFSFIIMLLCLYFNIVTDIPTLQSCSDFRSTDLPSYPICDVAVVSYWVDFYEMVFLAPHSLILNSIFFLLEWLPYQG